MSTNRDNGAEVTTVQMDTLVLTYDRLHDHLDIGGQCNSLDLMLDMLARAKRTLEAKQRQQVAVETAQLIQQAARDQQVKDALLNRRM